MRALLPTLLLPAGLLAALAAPAPADVVVLGSAADNTLYEDLTGTSSNGAGIHMFAGRTATGERRRALVRFDVAGALPAGSTVHSAQLTLSMSMTISGNQAVTLHRVLASWGEAGSDAPVNEGQGAVALPGDATWLHTSSPSSTWASAGGDFVATASATRAVNAPGSYSWSSTAQVIADVQGWLDAPATNHGWLLRGNEASAATAKRFDTRENVVESRRPMLTIDYTPPAAQPGAPFCFGNGAGTACPCGNTGGLDEGCAHSGGSGMKIGGSGTTSIAADDFTVTATGCPLDNSGIFYSGTSSPAAGLGQVLYDGLQCAGGDVRRYQGRFQSTGTVSDTGFVAQDPSGVYFVPGGVYHFQYWTRDVASGLSACGTGANFSPGYVVTMTP